MSGLCDKGEKCHAGKQQCDPYWFIAHYPCTASYESLVKGSDDNPDIKFQIVPFENTPENAREILANLGKNIDVVGGIFDDTMLNVRACAGLELVRGHSTVPFLFIIGWLQKIN